MSTDTNPPVGATVVDGRGYAWRFAEDALWHWIVGNGVQITVGVQPSDHESALTALWRMQQRAEQAEAELAKLRALAVEAKEMVDDGTPSQAGLLRYETGDLHRFIEHLAALATPNQEPPR